MQSDGTLLITSKMKQEQLYKIKEFDTSKIPKANLSLTSINRCIYSRIHYQLLLNHHTRMPDNRTEM